MIAVIHTTNAFLPLLLAARNGTTDGKIPKAKVINISSSLGSPYYTVKTTSAQSISYSVSKAALNLVSAKFAARFKDEGVLFIAVEPGLMKTMEGREYCCFRNYEGALAYHYPLSSF